MDERHIFISVGATATPAQEDFVVAVEDRLRSEGLFPHTIGRNTFSSDAPLKAVLELCKTCSGAVVIALERSYFPTGLSKRGGPNQTTISDITLPTPWNQIEAAISYTLNLPLMVIVEKGIRQEGLLEHGYDWYVQEVNLERSALTTPEFNGVFASWKRKVLDKSATPAIPDKIKTIADMSILELAGTFTAAQLWKIVVPICSAIGAAYAAGRLKGGH